MRHATIACLTLVIISAAMPGVTHAQFLEPDDFLFTFMELLDMVEGASDELYAQEDHKTARMEKIDHALRALRVPSPSSPTGFRYTHRIRQGYYTDITETIVDSLFTARPLTDVRGSFQGSVYEVNFFVPHKRTRKHGNYDVFLQRCSITYYVKGVVKTIFSES